MIYIYQHISTPPLVEKFLLTNKTNYCMPAIAPRRRKRKTKIQRPYWIGERAFPEFLRLREQLRRRIGPKALTQKEFNSLALLEFARKSHSDAYPTKPEFPAWKPKFPATPTRRLKLPGFENIKLLVKDESLNPTGTHKDRMAWETVVLENTILRHKAAGKIAKVPQQSIISSGNTAVAIGEIRRRFGLPPVKVLVDNSMQQQTIERIENHNVRVYATNLHSGALLNSDDILRLTRNRNGIDLTRGRYALELSKSYYDWMSFEILNQRPGIVIVPYGTGQLFDNISEHYEQQIKAIKADPRLFAQRMREGGMHLVGVSAPLESIADKLASPLIPESTKREFLQQKRNIVTQKISAGVLGELSRIEELEDKWFFEASRIALEHKITAEPSALAGIAWLLKHKKLIPKGARVLIVNTGRGAIA